MLSLSIPSLDINLKIIDDSSRDTLSVRLAFINPGRWAVVISSAESFLDGKIPINVMDLSRHDKIAQIA